MNSKYFFPYMIFDLPQKKVNVNECTQNKKLKSDQKLKIEKLDKIEKGLCL